jgi:hypothetical protein
MDADIGAVDLLLHDQGAVRNKCFRLRLAEMLVVVGPFGAEEMRRSRVLDEISL